MWIKRAKYTIRLSDFNNLIVFNLKLMIFYHLLHTADAVNNSIPEHFQPAVLIEWKTYSWEERKYKCFVFCYKGFSTLINILQTETSKIENIFNWENCRWIAFNKNIFRIKNLGAILSCIFSVIQIMFSFDSSS